jgi:hypothetical protein
LCTKETKAQTTAFVKAQDLKKIDQIDKYRKVVIAVNQWKKVPKWINTLKAAERKIIMNTSLFYESPFSPELNVNLVKPFEFMQIVDDKTPRDTTLEDLLLNAKIDFPVTDYDFSSELPSRTTGIASPSTIIDGTARFLVNRTKQELEIAFFDEFRKRIERDTLMPFLLPETHRLLRYQDYFQAPTMGSLWTTAFENDLNNMPLNMDKFLRLQCPQYYDSTALFVFSLGINCFGQLKEGIKVPTLLDNLTEDFAFIDNKQNLLNKKIYNTFKFLNILSNELIESKEGQSNFKWIERTAFKELGAAGQRYFWTLVYRQNMEFFDKNIGKMTNVKKFDGSYRVVGDFLDVYSKLNNAISLSTSEDSPSAAALAVTQQIIRGVELYARIDTLFNPDHKGSKMLFYDQFLPIAESSLSIMTHAQKKEYGAMSLQIVKSMEAILIPMYGKKAPERLKILFFYMNFMVDVITAEDGVKIEKIIARYALPSQSYRLKRNSNFSISINSFSGLSLGTEKTLAENNIAGVSKWGAIGGVTAPIGTALNWGKKGKNKESAYSLFVPIIDIGAAFSYRWSNSASGFPDDLRWSQVFSPGAYFVWGIPRTPITAVVGGQLTPKLRNINITGTNVVSNTIRFGVNLSVDIPFFNLYKR